MMKALVLEEVGKLEYKEVEKPVPKAGEVIVRVKAAGICGSDVPRAYKEGAHNMPLIIGHEFAGIVDSVGDGISADLVGKRVGVFPLIPCKKCRPCRNGQYEMCRNYNYLGSRCNGGFAEYVAVPEWNLMELPDNVSYEAAAMIEPMAVACHAMKRSLTGLAHILHRRCGMPSARLERPESGRYPVIAVCGLGTIGTFLVTFILEAGYKNLLVIGNKEFQKKTVSELGVPAENYCDSRKENAHDFIMDHTDGYGADVFFECVGSNEVASFAVDSVAPAGRICFVGNPHSDMTFDKPVYWKILRNQITINGTWNSSFLGDDEIEDDWRYVLKRLASGKVDAERLITQRYSLEDIPLGFELMRDKTEDYVKVMCTIE